MLITIKFESYNKYRFQKPWICKVTEWPGGTKPAVTWGIFQGNEDGGDAEIIAIPGDVVRWGQKGPSPKQTKKHWGIVQANGSVEECTMAQARKAWQTKSVSTESHPVIDTRVLAMVSDEILLEEVKRRGLI